MYRLHALKLSDPHKNLHSLILKEGEQFRCSRGSEENAGGVQVKNTYGT